MFTTICLFCVGVILSLVISLTTAILTEGDSTPADEIESSDFS